MDQIRSVPGLRNYYQHCPTGVRTYFNDLPKLLELFSLDVALAYVFARLELAHNKCLYCGVVKLHRCEAGLAQRAVHGFHMTREGFRDKFKAIYGEPVPDAATRLLARAEVVRDNVLHGKDDTDDRKRNAIANVLEYAALLNTHIENLGGPKPFGDLRGFKGAAVSLEKNTSRWVLKGIGFAM